MWYNIDNALPTRDGVLQTNPKVVTMTSCKVGL